MSTPIHCLERCGLVVRDRKMDLWAFGRRGDTEPPVVALVNGYRRHDQHAAVVRLHSACFTGDILGSEKCDCGPQLHAALDIISRAPWGILVYFLRHEGRGIGLLRKMRAYTLQEEGFDTVSANVELHAPIDDRHYEDGIDALKSLGVSRLWLLTNSPSKATSMVQSELSLLGIQRLTTGLSIFNQKYMSVKEQYFGHLLRSTDISEAEDSQRNRQTTNRRSPVSR
jgi:GTP cyclohydrolase II